MPRKKRKGSPFGKRLHDLRRQHDLTQVQLAEAIGATQRAISYYESEGAWPPAPVIADLARALDVTADELLGLRRSPSAKPLYTAEQRRLWKKFQQVTHLPEKDQRAVFRLLNTLVSVTANGNTPRRSRAITASTR